MIKEILKEILREELNGQKPAESSAQHPFVGKRCIVRTYSAGVHFGRVESIAGTEVQLSDSCRLWRWEGGGLSLSAVNRLGIKKGRINRTGDILLTEVIELIPTTETFEKSWEAWLEDE